MKSVIVWYKILKKVQKIFISVSFLTGFKKFQAYNKGTYKNSFSRVRRLLKMVQYFNDARRKWTWKA